MTTSRAHYRVTTKPRQLEALAFYLGAHNIDPASTIEEIETRFIQEASEEQQEPRRKLHALKAQLEKVRKERPESETLWQRVRKELGDTPPSYFHGTLLAIFACVALALDTIFLAPTMDILNIASVPIQFLSAAGIAGLCTAYFELVGLLYFRGTHIAHKWIAAAVGLIGILILSGWGLLRGYELRFAARIAGNPLGDFLANHHFLAALFFIFITLSMPIVGASALLYGWEEFSAARTWRRVRDRFERLRTEEVELTRKVQAETEHLAEFDRRKTEACREWKAIFASFYERGQRNGARREPLWTVILKSSLGAAISSSFLLILPLAWFPADLAAPVVPGLLLFAFFNHRRIHPPHERYLKQENTQFAVIPDARKPREIRAPEPRLLSKGDPS